MGSFSIVLRRRAGRGALAAACVFALAGCTDAATRIAYDLEAGAQSLKSSAETRAAVRHEPSRWPEGCDGGYDLEIGRGAKGDPGKGSITVRCAGRGLYYTTYHLNFVVVPATLGVRKEAGAPVLLQLEKRGGGIALTEIQ
jgi:hypothetical protein